MAPGLGRNRGFTLIELLAVIAILGLLMAILFPSLSAARQRAKANVCLTRLKAMGTMTALYLNENKDTFYPVRMDRLRASDAEYYVNDFGRRRPRWQWFLETDYGPVIDPRPFAPQINSEGSFGDDTRGRAHPLMMSNDLFSCPSLVEERFERNIRDGAYGYNYQYLGNTRTDNDPRQWDNFAVGMHRIRSPSRTVLIGESRGAGRGHWFESFMLDPPRLAEEARAKRFGPDVEWVQSGLEPAIYAYSPAEARHSNLTNVVFVDSHAETMTLNEMGYQFTEADTFPGVRAGEAIPVPHSSVGPYEANNQLWTGLGQDPVAAAANQSGGP